MPAPATTTSLDWTTPPPGTNLRTVAAAAAFIIWAQSLFYLRAFKSTGKFVSMVIAMCVDIQFFVLILGIFILAAGNSFFLLFAECEADECDAGWTTPTNTIYSAFNMLILGDFDGAAIDGTNEYHVTRTVFVLSQFIVAIVLLNLLIAIMGETYGAINDKAELEFYKLRADLLVELEIFESPSSASTNFPARFFFADESSSRQRKSKGQGAHEAEAWRPPSAPRPASTLAVSGALGDGPDIDASWQPAVYESYPDAIKNQELASWALVLPEGHMPNNGSNYGAGAWYFTSLAEQARNQSTGQKRSGARVP